MGAGKSTVAEIIAGIYGHSIQSLGAKIHSECKLHGKETREEMQQYGQMMRKVFGENVWCDYLIKKINNSKFENTVIDDARQLNEYNYFISRGFLPVGVVSSDSIRLERLKKRVNYEVNEKTKQHETEDQARQNIKNCQIIIENNGSIEELKLQIRNKLDNIIN
jgi:dephospho-CoA kinase